MSSAAWTELAKPYISALPPSIDEAIKVCANELWFAVHTDDKPYPDLCNPRTYADVSAIVDDLGSRFLDDEGASNLAGLLSASRFCQAHSRFVKKSVFTQAHIQEKGFSELLAHTMAARTDHVSQQTLKVATDSITFRPSPWAPHTQDPSRHLSYLTEAVQERSLKDIPQKDPKGRLWPKEMATFVNSTRDSILSICSATEMFYREKHREELEEMASAEAAIRAQRAQAG